MSFNYSLKFLFNNQVNKIVTLLEQENFKALAGAKDDPKMRSTLKRSFSFKATQIIQRLNKLGYQKPDIDNILKYINSMEELNIILDFSAKAKTLQLKYFTPKYTIKALQKHWAIPVVFEIAEKFEQHNLEENTNFANYDKLFTYPNFTHEHALNLVNILIQFKYHEIDITQDQIIKYFNASRPDSEDLKNFYLGVLITKEKNLDLKLHDFIKGIIDKRQPKSLALTYAKIKDNSLAISKERYMAMGIEQSAIDKIVNFMILAKKHDIYIDFDDVIKQYSSGSKVLDTLRILIKLHESGFKNIDFSYLTKLAKLNVDLSKIISAFNYANKNLSLDEFIKATDRVLPIRKNSQDPFNILNFAKALHVGTSVFQIDADAIINDYINGFDAWTILDLMKYAKDNGVDINYTVAKILFNQGKLKDIINQTLNPFELESDYIHVTTKDNIEIKVKLIILVTYNLKNYFKGTGEEYLLRLVKALFIHEVQQHYDHDEVIMNIEKISGSILKKLSPPSESDSQEDNFYDYVKVNKFNPVKILIPQVEFVRDTFKQIDKLKHEYHLEKQLADLEVEKLRAEVKIKEAWAQSKDLRYLILKDEYPDSMRRPDIHKENPEK